MWLIFRVVSKGNENTGHKPGDAPTSALQNAKPISFFLKKPFYFSIRQPEKKVTGEEKLGLAKWIQLKLGPIFVF